MVTFFTFKKFLWSLAKVFELGGELTNTIRSLRGVRLKFMVINIMV